MNACPVCSMVISSGASDGVTHDWCRSIEHATRLLLMSPCFRCLNQFGEGLRFSVLVGGRSRAICQTCLTAVMIFHEPLVVTKKK